MSNPAGAGMAIVEAREGGELAQARQLLAEYFAALEVDLGEIRQREIASLPGEYAAPGGFLLLASRAARAAAAAEAAGCVALRRLQPAVCELKRLYVRPAHRGAGLGRRLAVAAIAGARRLGYERMRLDTLPSMAGARALYAELGFREIPPYREILLPGVTFLELALADSAAATTAAGR
jgi:GNAT superfamily N-acetyltransferase